MLKGKNRDHRIIGICAAGIINEYCRSLITSISKAANARGYNIMIFGAFSDLFYDNMFTNGEQSIFALGNAELLDALIVLPESIKNEEIWSKTARLACESGLPVICIDRKVKEYASIVFDYGNAFEEIVSHVVEEHGCRRVNFIAGIKGNEFSEERLGCYKRVLERNGIEYDPRRVGYGDFWEQPTLRVMKEFLESDIEFPEAIVCCNDTTAMTALRVLRENGYRIPQDIIVTGFDGIELEKYSVPRLTTAAPDIDLMGVRAVDLVDMAMEGRALPETTVIPFKVRHSESCGCRSALVTDYTDKIMELQSRINSSDGHEEHMFAYVYHTVDFMDFDELGKTMVRFADYYTWCCLNTDFISDNSETERYHDYYTKNMHLLMKCEGVDNVVRNVIFPTQELLPNIEEALEKHKMILFAPIHFRSEVMGYMAVSVNSDSFNFKNTHRFINNTNQIFENLKNRIRLQRAYADISEMHLRDPMTGIYNRRGFYKRAEELARDYPDGRFVLFSADLDFLKEINDTYGHSMGDKAILAAAQTLCGSSPEEVRARFGGDEFIVLARAENPEGCISSFGKRVKERLEALKDSGIGYKMSISLGAAVMGAPTIENIDAAMREADRKMYEVKRISHKEAEKDVR